MIEEPLKSPLAGDPPPDLSPEDDSDDEMENKPAFRGWMEAWDNLVRFGLGEIAVRLGTGVGSLIMIMVVVWVMGTFYLSGEAVPDEPKAQAAALPTATPTLAPPPLSVPYTGAYHNGVARLAKLDTLLPSRPRHDVTTYEVQEGDTIFGISEMFNLKPETILWGNYYILGDDIHRLSPGQVLNILPIDGVYYEWHAGDGLNGVAEFYGVTPEMIIDWPGNRLDADALGDWADPNIAPGAWLVIPGGRREFVVWSAPRITREDPAVASIMGPGACGAVYEGPIGSGFFIWPSIEKYLSGYDYSPATNHYGIDIAGNVGYAVFAVDDGVVVYSGWNDWGYGYVIVIDHGNGWQSLYAHLNAMNVGCGAGVYQGDIIGTVGNTGNSSGAHLHFELRSDEYGRPNPWNFLAQ